ncbi:MAG: hypothetical protein JKX69_07325 [Rhodobacteraceae bacterium]|nr:hypothetical protein [Paracoccaceae bacterium]
MIWRLTKILFILLVLAALAFIAYAYLGPIFFASDFAAPAHEVTETVILGQ